MFFGVIFFVASGILPRDIGVLYCTEIGSSIRLDNDEVADVDM